MSKITNDGLARSGTGCFITCTHMSTVCVKGLSVYCLSCWFVKINLKFLKQFDRLSTRLSYKLKAHNKSWLHLVSQTVILVFLKSINLLAFTFVHAEHGFDKYRKTLVYPL